MGVVMADDDVDDCRLIADAWQEAGCSSLITFVHGGGALLDYLAQRSPYTDVAHVDVVLLDLNMPRVSGWDVLEEMRAVPTLSWAPVVVLTTSSSRDDVDRAFELGVSGFVTKPRLFSEMVHVAKIIDEYWFSVSKLPGFDARPLRSGAD